MTVTANEREGEKHLANIFHRRDPHWLFNPHVPGLRQGEPVYTRSVPK